MLVLKKDDVVLDKMESLPVINFGKSKIMLCSIRSDLIKINQRKEFVGI